MTVYQGRPTDATEREAAELAVYNLLDTLGIGYTTACHDPAFSMEACAAVERELGVAIAKNLFLCNRQQTDFYLVMLPGSKVFKTKYLSAQLGCSRLSFASDGSMMSLLGIKPGSVSPMGLMNPAAERVRLVIDRDLLQDEWIGIHPCFNTATVKLRTSDLTGRVLPALRHSFTPVILPDGRLET